MNKNDCIELHSKFKRTLLNTNINIESIITLHYFEYTKDYIGHVEAHDFWELVYVDVGKVKVLADDKEHILHQGEVIFHKPWEKHAIISYNMFANSFILTFDCHSHYLDILYNKIISTTLYEQHIISKLIHEARDVFLEPLNIMFQKNMIKNQSYSFGAEQIIKNNIEELLILFIRHFESKTSDNDNDYIHNHVDKKSEEKVFRSTIQIMNQHIEERLTLNEISIQVGASKSKIEKIFKHHTGIGVMQYFNELKIKEAKKLLSNQALSVT